MVQCANEIYPIVGISFVGHKLQLLALLMFIKEERQNNALVSNPSSGTKGKREVRNLESLVNYDTRGASTSHSKRKGRGQVVKL